jgi:hypothetical protein
VALGFTNPYAYFQKPTSGFGIKNDDFLSSPEAKEALKKWAGRSVGVDFATGRRNVDWAGDLMEKIAPKATVFTQNPFAVTTQPSVTQDIFGLVPSTETASQLTPSELGVDAYVDLAKKLAPLQFEQTVKENVLGLGAATAFGAASLPFTEYMRNQELGRQMQAFKMKEESPTAQAARSLSLQQQAGMAAEASAQKLQGRAAARRAAIEPLRRRG